MPSARIEIGRRGTGNMASCDLPFPAKHSYRSLVDREQSRHDPQTVTARHKNWYKIGLDGTVGGGLQWDQQRKHNGRNPR